MRNSLVALLEALCARDNRDSALDYTVKLYTNCRNRRLPSPPPCFFQISYVFLLSVSMKYVARKYMFYILINMNSHHQYLILLIFLSKQYASRLTCLVGTFVVKQNLERPKRTNEEVKHLVEKILVPLVGFVDAGQLVRV